MKLVGDKVYLRYPKVTDVKRILEIVNNPDVKPMLGVKNKPKKTVKQEIAWIKKRPEARKNKIDFDFVIIEKDTDYMIGICSLHYDKYDKKADIGTCIAPKFWGKKYGREGVQLLLSYCFKKLDLDLVIAQAYDFNEGSNKLLSILGFNHDATLRKYCLKKDGSRCSLNHFSITLEEFNANNRNK
jgi:[ribosomal protein S5]-alanine N-acetyltransferase